jgi:hypothetical protein
MGMRVLKTKNDLEREKPMVELAVLSNTLDTAS